MSSPGLIIPSFLENLIITFETTVLFADPDPGWSILCWGDDWNVWTFPLLDLRFSYNIRNTQNIW